MWSERKAGQSVPPLGVQRGCLMSAFPLGCNAALAAGVRIKPSGSQWSGLMSAEASALLKKAQDARQQAKRARRLAHETSDPDVATQLSKYAEELDERATTLEQRAAAVVMPKPRRAEPEKAAKGEQPRGPAKPK
jgi:hypothetical protein